MRLWLRPAPTGAAVGGNGAGPAAAEPSGALEDFSGRLEVRYGQLIVMPIGYDQSLEVEVELEPGVSLGAARRGRQLRTRVRGGAVGLIIDARDMPIALPRRLDDRETVLTSWHETFVREHHAHDDTLP